MQIRTLLVSANCNDVHVMTFCQILVAWNDFDEKCCGKTLAADWEQAFDYFRGIIIPFFNKMKSMGSLYLHNLVHIKETLRKTGEGLAMCGADQTIGKLS